MDVDVDEEIELHLKVDELDKRHKSEKLSTPHLLPSIDESSLRVVLGTEDEEVASPSSTAAAKLESVADVVQELQRLTESKTGKSGLLRKVVYRHKPSDIELTGWILDDIPPHKDCQYPTQARGLFTRQLQDGSTAIVVRGYDKFYNTGEIEATTWDSIEETTTGPYEVTVKEPGFVVYVTALEGHLLVTSKTTVGHGHREGATGASEQSMNSELRLSITSRDKRRAALGQYVLKGEEWALRHLASVGKTKEDLISWLSEHDVTAVFELVDDDVEEQALEHTNEKKGLYVHGINSNTLGFHSWSSSRVSEFATAFGFHFNPAPSFQSLAEVKVLSDKCAETGTYQGRHVEGFVVRCQVKQQKDVKTVEEGKSVEEEQKNSAAVTTTDKSSTGGKVDGPQAQSFFFKVKFNIPLLLFREWRDITKKVLTGKAVQQPEHPLSQKYVVWVQEQAKAQPQVFEQYLENKGVVGVRDAFLRTVNLPTDPASLADALRTVKVSD